MRVSAAAAEEVADGVLGTVRVEPEEARILVSLADQLQALLADALDASADRDSAFSLLVGAATSPFDADDYGIDSVRITIGSQRGF